MERSTNVALQTTVSTNAPDHVCQTIEPVGSGHAGTTSIRAAAYRIRAERATGCRSPGSRFARRGACFMLGRGGEAMSILELSFASGEGSLSVRTFAVRESISGLFSVSIVARSPNDDIDLESLVGHPAMF